ncbi:MAG: (2Fe-2S)-binding protein [Negativibacillus massiliensis]
MEYICYCDKVTEEDIVRAIGQGARTIRDIQRMTGAMTNCDCANKNPKGT